MHRFKLLIISFVVFFFVSCYAGKIQMVGVNYEFRERCFAFEVLYENKTDSVLLFPDALKTCMVSVYEDKNSIVINECNAGFKNLDEMINMQLAEKLMDENDYFTKLRILEIPPGHKFICTNIIMYSKIPEHIIKEKGEIEIRMNYGMTKNIEYTRLKKIKAKGSLKKYSEKIKLEGDSRNDLGELPYHGFYPVCDLECCIHFDRLGPPDSVHFN